MRVSRPGTNRVHRPPAAQVTADAQKRHTAATAASVTLPHDDRTRRSPGAEPTRASRRAGPSGPASAPQWTRPALLGLLAATGVLYLWGLSASGWANAFYSAAAQAGSQSWKALFFGSSDAANSITVDKTPASLWVMALSVRVFGVNSWSHPRAAGADGRRERGLLYAAVRRWFDPVAGLLAGAVLALTPVAVLMFRFNNPDALLVLLLVAGAYATVRATRRRPRARWLLLAGALVGFGFLTKMLQAFLVVPALALVYLVAAPTDIAAALAHLLLAGRRCSSPPAGGWRSSSCRRPRRPVHRRLADQQRPRADLRLQRPRPAHRRGDGQRRRRARPAGVTRVDAHVRRRDRWPDRLAAAGRAGRCSWRALAPPTGAAYRPQRAALLLWGGWLVVTGLVFSFMQGIFHAYYTVALAPAIGAMVGIGGVVLWSGDDRPAGYVLAATLAVTAIWAYVLLGRSPDFVPLLRVRDPGRRPRDSRSARGWRRRCRGASCCGSATAVLIALAGPAAYAVRPRRDPHRGRSRPLDL